MQETIEIIYSDDSLLVVNKPTLLLSVPGRGEDKQDCLINRLRSQFPSALTVHRLDWETSGLTVIALNKHIHRELSKQFEQRLVHKQYMAIVYGRLPLTSGEINLPLRCDWENRPRQIVDPIQGKPAQTFWQVIGKEANGTRLRLTPITGRSHQLRVHLQAIGHPILGDRLYADDTTLQLASRLLLHASLLEFTHPDSNQQLTFKSTAPF